MCERPYLFGEDNGKVEFREIDIEVQLVRFARLLLIISLIHCMRLVELTA
jgi:hypothetical protein